MICLIDWFTVWLIDWLDWLVDWLIGWLVDWLIVWLIGWLFDWLVDCLIDWLIDWLIDRLMDWLIDWLIVWSNDWLIDWLFDWLIEYLHVFNNIFCSGCDGGVVEFIYILTHLLRILLFMLLQYKNRNVFILNLKYCVNFFHIYQTFCFVKYFLKNLLPNRIKLNLRHKKIADFFFSELLKLLLYISIFLSILNLGFGRNKQEVADRCYRYQQIRDRLD